MQVSCSFFDGLLEVSAANLGQQVNCSHCMLDFELTAASYQIVLRYAAQ